MKGTFMDLAAALELTASDKGPSSYLERYLASIEGTPTGEAVKAELLGQRQAAHLARALTELARADGVIGDSATISGQSVTKWRSVHGPR